MEYNIIRLENIKDKHGNEEIFIFLRIIDDDGFEFEIYKWMTSTEISNYKITNNLIDFINENKNIYRKIKNEEILYILNQENNF